VPYLFLRHSLGVAHLRPFVILPALLIPLQTLSADMMTWWFGSSCPRWVAHGNRQRQITADLGWRLQVTTQLNGYLKFPHVAQAFMIEREVIHKKSGKTTLEKAYGITSRSADHASPEDILRTNRGHWCIENSCHYILDWNFDEDRCRIRTGHGPENMTRLRRFAISICKLRDVKNVAQKMRELSRNTRLVFDYLRMTKNSCVPG
jgi:predicted transposase YbfD/YdcC